MISGIQYIDGKHVLLIDKSISLIELSTMARLVGCDLKRHETGAIVLEKQMEDGQHDARTS